MVKKRKSKFNKRAKPRREKLKLLVLSFLILGVLTLIGWGVLKLIKSPFFKAKITWDIDTTLPITQTTLENSIQLLTQDKYQFDADDIKAVLESHPWIAKVAIDKQWFSNDIQIKVTPQQIAMRWENTDCHAEETTNCTGYISTNGELFQPKKTVDSKAPLARSQATVEIITQLYQDYKGYQQQTKAMPIQVFSKTHIDTLIFKSGVRVVLGYQQKQQRLARFLKAYQTLQADSARVENLTFDMRYPKGFSLEYHDTNHQE
jgi:cell division protein FtsQ